MKFSIITINFNHRDGLQKTIESVINQTYSDYEYIIIDGGSDDGSVEVIKEYSDKITYWVSERDKGIYNGMNKGITKANGTYINFMNSGDVFYSKDTLEKVCSLMDDSDFIIGKDYNKDPDTGEVFTTILPTRISMAAFHMWTLPHQSAFIRRSLFDHSPYDESLRIVADWKFYMQSIVLGKATTKHVDIIVTHFDMNGISETRKDILNEERNRLLQELIPKGILKDYDRYHFPMEQYDRLKRYHLWGLVWFVERVLFKLEKWGILK